MSRRALYRQGACRFCAIIGGTTFYGAADRPIHSVCDYVAIASIGALVEGWTLVVPKEHCFSLRDLYPLPSFMEFVRSVTMRVEASYGASAIFEHGANHEGSLTSCGTDHAHLHIVPLPFSMSDAIGASRLSSWERIPASTIRGRVSESEYLFFSESPRQSPLVGYFQPLASPTSQFFRRIVAMRLGLDGVSDYRVHPFLDTTQRTRERLATVSS